MKIDRCILSSSVPVFFLHSPPLHHHHHYHHHCTHFFFRKRGLPLGLRFTLRTLRITTGRFCPIVAAGVVPQSAGTTSDAGVRTGNEFDTRTLDDMMPFHFPGVGKGKMAGLWGSRSPAT